MSTLNHISNCIRTLSVLALSAAFVAGCGEDSPTGPSGGGSGSNGAIGEIVGSVDLPDGADAVMVSGNHAFVAATGQGLQIVDVSDVTEPAIVSGVTSIYATGNMLKLDVSSREYVYVTGGLSGIHVVNVTDRLAPTLAISQDTAGIASDVAATPGDVLCVADGTAGVQLFFGGDQNTIDTPGRAQAVAARGEFCFAVDLPSGAAGGALHVIDVSSPASASLVTTLPLGGSPAGITIIDDKAYVAAGDPGMFVIDISNPLSPSVVGETEPLPATGRIVADPLRDYVLLGTTDTAGFPNDGLKIIDVSDPSDPQVAGTVDLPDWTKGIAVLGERLVVVTGPLAGGTSTLHVVDLGEL